MTTTDDAIPELPLRGQLRGLPDAPLPDGLWRRVNAARARRYQRRRIGLATAAMAVIAVVALPWLRSPDSTTAPPPAAVADTRPAMSTPSIDTDAQLRTLDRALQAGYERNASDAELTPLWAARARLIADKNVPSLPTNIQRI